MIAWSVPPPPVPIPPHITPSFELWACLTSGKSGKLQLVLEIGLYNSTFDEDTPPDINIPKLSSLGPGYLKTQNSLLARILLPFLLVPEVVTGVGVVVRVAVAVEVEVEPGVVVEVGVEVELGDVVENEGHSKINFHKNFYILCIILLNLRKWIRDKQ